MKQTPLKKLKDGLITATIWVNKTDGDKDRYSVTLVRSYLKDDKWHETSSFGGFELLRAGRLAEVAYDFIREHRGSAEKPQANA